MNPKTAAPRRWRLLALWLLLPALPACHGAGPWYRNTEGAPYQVYKPVPTSLRGRPFYVVGYGGADYSPDRPRRRALMPGESAGPVADPALNPAGVTVSQGTWDEP
jgi:hypothetical protein